MKEYFDEKSAIAMETEERKLTGRYDELKQRVDTLKSQLQQVIYKTVRIYRNLGLLSQH